MTKKSSKKVNGAQKWPGLTLQKYTPGKGEKIVIHHSFADG
jgi:hypothetical protein